MKTRSQILYQLAEIHPAVGSEEENNLAGIKGIFHIDQLHIELVSRNKLLADSEGFLFLPFIFIAASHVLFGRLAEHLA